MNTLPPPYPLTWPEHQRRSKQRTASSFKTTKAKAIDNVERSMRLFAKDSGKDIRHVVLTSNVGGLISTGQPDDTGVAVWMVWDGETRCIAVDRYRKVEENLQAIHHVIEARRTEMRHAGIEMVRTTFRGLTALPPPRPNSTQIVKATWWQILEVAQDATRAEIQKAYKAKSRETISENERATLNAARDEALAT